MDPCWPLGVPWLSVWKPLINVFVDERMICVYVSCWMTYSSFSAIDTVLYLCLHAHLLRTFLKKAHKWAWNVATHLSSSTRGGAFSHSCHSCLPLPFAFSRSLSGMICFPDSICTRSARFTMRELIKRFGAFSQRTISGNPSVMWKWWCRSFKV